MENGIFSSVSNEKVDILKDILCVDEHVPFLCHCTVSSLKVAIVQYTFLLFVCITNEVGGFVASFVVNYLNLCIFMLTTWFWVGKFILDYFLVWLMIDTSSKPDCKFFNI